MGNIQMIILHLFGTATHTYIHTVYLMYFPVKESWECSRSNIIPILQVKKMG